MLQGDTWGPLLASVQVDNIAKHVEKANLGIHCKGSLPISLLGLMDDVIGIDAMQPKVIQRAHDKILFLILLHSKVASCRLD